MEHLALNNSGSDAAPFIQSGNTVLRLSDVQFTGALYHPVPLNAFNFRALSGVTIAGASMTCSGGQFTAADVGAAVIGANIPADTYIESYQSVTSVTLSASVGSFTGLSPVLVYSYQDAVVL